MKIDRHPPMTRGVQTLMYVGDDAAPAPPKLIPWWLVAGGLLAAAWWLSKTER